MSGFSRTAAAPAVICAACGAKVKAARSKCPRCQQPLVARQAPAAPRPIPWTTVGIVGACVALGGISIVLMPSSSAPQPQAASTDSRPLMTLPAGTTGAAGVASNVAPPVGPDPAAHAMPDLVAGQKAYFAGNVDAAIAHLQAAVDAAPNDHRALSDLGQALIRAGRAKEAVEYLDKAVQLSPDTWAYQFNRARAYAQLKEWDKAVDGYRAAAALFPDDYPTEYNLGKALQASGNLDGALTAYEKAIALAPGQSDFLLSYGLALEAAKRPQDASAAYKRYLELEPDSADAEKVKGHLAQLAGPAPAKGTQ